MKIVYHSLWNSLFCTYTMEYNGKIYIKYNLKSKLSKNREKSNNKKLKNKNKKNKG